MAAINICPFCKKLGLKSKLQSRGCSSTLMGGGGKFYDEEGKEHIHDLNTISELFTCSNEHTFLVKFKRECPSCDVNHEEPTIELHSSDGRGPFLS